MSWSCTSDLDRFAAAAGGYLRARTAENTLLLSAVRAARVEQTVRAGKGGPPGAAAPAAPLFGWWEPPDGGAARGAFVHDPAVPLLISGRVPEMAAALAATLARTGRRVCGVDAPTDAADAFAAAWSQRAGTVARVHQHCRVYRLTGPGAARITPPAGALSVPAGISRGNTVPPGDTPAPGGPYPPGTGTWPPEAAGPAGRLRVAAGADRPLLAAWLAAFAAETAQRIGSLPDLAADLIGYGGAVFWEAPDRQPAALATLTRPVARSVRIGIVYSPPERRRGGYASALTHAVSRAVLAGPGPADQGRALLAGASGPGRVDEVVIITDSSRPDRWGGRLGYELVGERTVLRFGPATGAVPRLPMGRSPRLPTGPLPRPPRPGR